MEDRYPEKEATSDSQPVAEKSAELLELCSAIVGKTRYVVLFAVAAVLLVAVSLFLQGTWQAILSVWHSWAVALGSRPESTETAIEFLNIVGVMLKAVVFYLIGVGLYGLFIAPLNLSVSLGVETLTDLEDKVLSVLVVIMSTTFLEHFIRWQDPLPTLQFGAALALVIGVLILFQRQSHQASTKSARPEAEQLRAQKDLFEGKQEKFQIPSATPAAETPTESKDT